MTVQRWVLQVYDGIKTLNTSHEGLMYKLDSIPPTLDYALIPIILRRSKVGPRVQGLVGKQVIAVGSGRVEDSVGTFAYTTAAITNTSSLHGSSRGNATTAGCAH